MSPVMGWPERGELAAPGARGPVRICADHAAQGEHLSGAPYPGTPVSPDQCQVCHPAQPVTAAWTGPAGAPAEMPDEEDAAAELDMARSLRDLAAANLSDLRAEMRELACQVLTAGDELRQAEERLAALLPTPPRTVAEVRVYATQQQINYQQLMAQMTTESARDRLGIGAAAMKTIIDYIDGNG